MSLTFILRKFVPEDAESLAYHANNPNISGLMTDAFPYPYKLNDAINFIEYTRNNCDALIYAIDIENKAVGGIGVHPQKDINRKNAELGYWLSQHYWGKGVMTAAVRQCIPDAFAQLDIYRIFARPFGKNIASKQVLLNAGFKLEAVIKKGFFKNGEFDDEYIYSLRRDDFFAHL